MSGIVVAIALVASAASPQTHRTARRDDVIHRIVIDGTATPERASQPSRATSAATASKAATSPQGGGAPPAEGTSAQPRQEQADAARPALQAAAQFQLEGNMALLEEQLQVERERTAALERQAEVDRGRWRSQVEEPVHRAQALTGEYYRLGQLDQALAAGSIDVGSAIAQARAGIAFAASNAGSGGWEAEANASGTASFWLAVSEEAMQRSDLYEARLAIGAAAREASRASQLASATAAHAGSRY